MDDDKIMEEQMKKEREAGIYRIYEEKNLVPEKINDEDIIVGG